MTSQSYPLDTLDRRKHLPSEYPSQINILSLNCWGLKYISKFRRERLNEIGAQIVAATPTPDIVGLQECWTREDYENICKQTQHILPYAKFYYAGVFGSGLAILSRWPIEESSMFAYPLNGRPTAFWRGDWYVGKGVACAKVRIGPAPHDVLEIFNTHLHAPYTPPNTSGAYKEHRTAQAWQISKLIRRASQAGHLAIALGDFNIVPSSVAYKIITTHGQALDVWRQLHSNSAVAPQNSKIEQRRQQRQTKHQPNGRTNPPITHPEPHDNQPTTDTKSKTPVNPIAIHNILENGTTCDSALNTWRWDKALRKQLHSGTKINEEEHLRAATDLRAKRLDYIFLGTSGAAEIQGRTWRVQDAHVGMTARHPILRCSLSDHFSVEATITLSSPFNNHQTTLNPSAPVHTRNPPAERFLHPNQYDKIQGYITSNLTRSHTQRKWRLLHFLLSLVVWLACLVAVWWVPGNYVAFLLMLVGSLALVSGVVDGLIGGLFFGTEIRALWEWQWEVRNVRERARVAMLEAEGGGGGGGVVDGGEESDDEGT